MTKPFRPMLAGKASTNIDFPLLGSAKIDGLRAMAMDTGAMSRSMKPLPNRHLQALFAASPDLIGLDGEVCVGDPGSDDCYRRTVSVVMSDDADIAGLGYYVFDRWDSKLPFSERLQSSRAVADAGPDWVHALSHVLLSDHAELEDYERAILSIGYEGVMLRDPLGPYKQGRSTDREGYLLKLKRYVDNEAVIIGFVEEMHNGNEATTSELGRTKRSSHQANKTGKDTLGVMQVRGINGMWKDVEFDVPGFTDAFADDVWRNQEKFLGQFITYKHFPIGAKDKPRHPGFVRLRDERDIDFGVAA